jgi:hypothetical protein
MADPQQLDKAFHFIISRMVETGGAPHYSELAKTLRCSVEEGRQTQHELMRTGFPGWLHPGTDYIVAFPPFSNLPTQYRITVGGAQKWYAQ